MTEVPFLLGLSTTEARPLFRARAGDPGDGLPWDTLDAAAYPAPVLVVARDGWTRMAFDEYRTALAFSELATRMGQARAPLDLWGLATRFAAEELAHLELCARMAMALGGASEIRFDPDALRPAASAALSPLQRASELVVRLCCVGEAFSAPMLAACARAAAPLPRAVLERLARDEVWHGRLGALYFEWLGPSLDAPERARLGQVARDAMEISSSGWEQAPLAGARDPHLEALGLLDGATYGAAARRAFASAVRAPLEALGLVG